MLASRIISLNLKNFRNITSAQVYFNEKINCFWGKNGNGKTNLLEAIYLFSNSKSFRKNVNNSQFISIDGNRPEVNLDSEFYTYNSILSSIVITKDKRIDLFNGKKNNKSENIPIFIINPFDSFEYFYTSSNRRKWLDENLSFLNVKYKKSLLKHKKIIFFKNKLLKDTTVDIVQLKSLNKQLAEIILFLYCERVKFLKIINPIVNKLFKNIFDSELNIDLNICGPFNNLDHSKIYELFDSNLSTEINQGFCELSANSDLVEINCNYFDMSSYSSLGQQKMYYFSINFAFLDLFYKIVGKYPIVLLDDISGELDSDRWQKLINYLVEAPFQVIFTTANETIKEYIKQLKFIKIFNISNGEIKEENTY